MLFLVRQTNVCNLLDMSARITCQLKAKSVIFFRDTEDKGFHSVRIDLCRTVPDIKKLSQQLAKEEWATAALVKRFEEMAMKYHGLHGKH